jgi:peptidoglycan/xylan/chitin deacetylase (PgdA/CDA1 family)
MKTLHRFDHGRVLRNRGVRLAKTIAKAILLSLIFTTGPMDAASQVLPIKTTDSSAEAAKQTAVKTLPAADLLRYAATAFEIRLPPPLPALPTQIFCCGSRREPRIALTFDACATRVPSGYDQRVIQVLVANRIPATLFLGGKWMAEHPDATRYLASQALFELGNHSFLHPHLTALPDERVRQELEWTQTVMYSLTGRQALLFRAPYGEIDERVAKLAAQMGLTAVQYDLASGDPDACRTADGLLKAVLQGARNGSIIVMHMNGRGWHTAEALPAIIAALHQRGFEFTNVGELIEKKRAVHEAVDHPARKGGG